MGPACGGTRMYPYATADDALTDVLRLSRGMSYKNAIADLPLGGGKAVILGDPARDKNDARLAAYAEAVNALGGRYITAMDVGVGPKDMPVIARGTKYVAGFDQPGKKGGDSGPLTALGVFVGLKAAVKHKLGTDTTKGLTIAIQGLGKVGQGVAKRLHAEGARLIVADVSEEAVRRAVDAFDAREASPDSIVTAECDVFSPNALGAILNDDTVMALRAKVVAGGANNQLARDAHGKILMERGVLYAPDYVVNGGGIIRVAGQIYDWDDQEIERRTLAIADTLSMVFKRADAERLPTNLIADRIAEERIARGKPSAAHAAE
jgi:leucine dehydrogenase